MKTYKIKDLLKKELLIVELPRVCDYELDDEMLWGINLENGFTYRAEGSYTLLGKPDEISEENAKEFVERIGDGDPCYQGDWFVNYQDHESMFETAKESLLSLLESEIYWDVNPYESKADSLVSDNSANGCALYRKAFHEFCEAEKKTFDRNRSIILVTQ